MKPSAFEKRIKRRIIARSHDFFAACPPGLRQICRSELESLDAEISDIRVLTGGVGFSGKLEAGCLANLMLHSPARILMRIARFRADRFDLLEKELSRIDWELFLPSGPAPDIRTTTRRSRLYHSDAIAQRTRPVIEAALTDAAAHTQSSPEAAGPSPQTLMIRAEDDRFTLSLDMSGSPLYKRGIKQQVTGAPIRENLAHAILSKARFSPDEVLVDPMCGSGTFTIEAAMIQTRVPPGFFRRFAFESWPGFRPAGFNYVKKQLKSGFTIPSPAPVFASDLDRSAVGILEKNLAGHEFLSHVHCRRTDFFDLDPAALAKKKGVVVLNPPYGRRLEKDRDIHQFYREIEKKLSADFKGWRAGIVFPQRQINKMKMLSLEAFPFFHGGLDLAAGVGTI